MYTEDLGNPRRFARIARRVSQRRPIVAVRTGADLGPTNSALYRHCGLIEVPTVTALLDTVRVLATQPVLRGDRIAVCRTTRARDGSAEAAITASGLRPVAPPIELDFRATPADYAAAIDAALAGGRHRRIDGGPRTRRLPAAVGKPVDEIDAAAARRGQAGHGRAAGDADGPITPGSTVPNFMFPEPAAAVLGRSWAYGRWLATRGSRAAGSRPTSTSSAPTSCSPAPLARGQRPARSGRDRTNCSRHTAIPVPPTRYVAAAEAAAAADRGRLSRGRQGAPPPRRTLRPRRRRPRPRRTPPTSLDGRGDAGGARRRRRLRDRPGDGSARTRPAHPARASTTRREPLISVGIGGIQAGLVGDDDPVRLAPLSRHSATALVTESRAGPALTQAGLDPAALVDTVIRVGPTGRRPRRDHRRSTSTR